MKIVLKVDSELERKVLNLLDFDAFELKLLENQGYKNEDIRKVVEDFDIRWELLLGL